MVYDQFLIVDYRATFTGIKAHLSPHMLLMKFRTCHSTGAIRGDQLSAQTCYATTLKSAALKLLMETLAVTEVPNGKEPIDDPRDETSKLQAQAAEDLETIILNEENQHHTHHSPPIRVHSISTPSL